MTSFAAFPLPTCMICHVPLQHLPRHTLMSEILGGPICADCARQKPYEEANTLLLGESDGGPSFSLEFEVCSIPNELPRAWQLLAYGYLRTEDCSVSDEYKSPRYQAFSEFEKVLPVLDSLHELVNECCGTHIHIACPRKVWLAAHITGVFERLISHWTRYKDETIAFWGRDTAPYGGNVRVSGRYNTLEFRLPRFRSAAQYRSVMLFCRQAGQMIGGWLENARDKEMFGRYVPLVNELLLDLYQQHSATALSTPTWGVHRPHPVQQF